MAFLQLCDALTAEIAKEPLLIAVDIAMLRVVDSGAMQMIVSARQMLRREEGTLVLVNPALQSRAFWSQ